MSSSPSVAPCPTELATAKDPSLENSVKMDGPTKEDESEAKIVQKQDNEVVGDGPSKQQRGRMKKLRKRAALFCSQTNLSGIQRRDEWEEVQATRALLPTAARDEDFAPWIGLRQNNKNKHQQDKVRDGYDHRYTLQYALNSTLTAPTTTNNNGRKRARQDESTPNHQTIPSWICLHNPSCIDHIAVLEVHLNGPKVKLADVEAMAEATLGASNAYPTKWFEGPRPQSISELLLYDKPTQPSNKKAKPVDLSQKQGQQEFLEALKSFILSEEELKKEGFPAPPSEQPPVKVGSSPSIFDEFNKPTTFSLEQAKEIVKTTHVTLKDKKFPFVQTPAISSNNKDDNKAPRVLGLDCEMVQTQNGTELGRVTLIELHNPLTAAMPTKGESFDTHYRVLMDELVKPYPPVTDYVTAYSGITAQLLQPVETRLEQIQASLLTYVRANDILVGQSLENDLWATRWIHPTIVDTALLFRGTSNGASFKHSLKHLSNVLLRKRIQNNSSGHCSEQDAAAALELVVRRALEGPSFAIYPTDKQWWIPGTPSSATVFLGPRQWIEDHVSRRAPPNGYHILDCDNVEHPNTKAILSWLTGPKRRAGLVWANLCLSTPEHLKLLEKLLVDLKAKMSTNTVLMVNIQSGYTTAADTSRQRRTRMDPKTTLAWSEEDEKRCRALVEDCRTGKVFWVSRHPGPAAGGGADAKKKNEKQVDQAVGS